MMLADDQRSRSTRARCCSSRSILLIGWFAAADARRAPDVVPDVRDRVLRLAARRARGGDLGGAPRHDGGPAPAHRPVQHPRDDGVRDRVRLHGAARREGPVRAARPAAAGPAPGPAGAANARAAAALPPGARHRASATGCCTDGSRRRRASRTRSSGPGSARRSRDCGGMFIKLGQVASTRSDLLPAPVIAELTQLQTAVAPGRPRRDPRGRRGGARPPRRGGVRGVRLDPARRRVDRSGPPRDARLRGRRRREGAAARGRRRRQPRHAGDAQPGPLRAAPDVDRPPHRRRHPRPRVHRRGERRARLHQPRDRPESGSATTGADDAGIHIPAVHLDLCTQRLLVLEEVSGVPVSDQAALDASPVPREELADRLLQLLPRPDPRGRRVPRRPAPGQHPARRGRHAEPARLRVHRHPRPRRPSRRSAACSLASTLNDPELLQRSVLTISPPPPGTDLGALEADLGRFMVAARERRDRLRRRDAQGDDRGAPAQPPAGADVAHVAQPRAHHARRDAAHDGPALRVRGAGPGARERRWSMPAADTDAMQEQLQKELLRAMPSLRTLPGHAEAIGGQLRSGPADDADRPVRGRRRGDVRP